jgi:serine/threonine protein kinase
MTRVGRQLAEALAYAHAAGVVHRDVKPGNVLLGEHHRAKLADFGIARLVGDTVRHTQTGTTIGTAAYLSPEQVQGRDVTGAADVYALGLVLIEAMTGERAYPGTPTEAALARLHRNPEVPPDLPHRDLLVAMTQRDPDARPTAAEVADGLTAPSQLAGATTTAVMPTAAPDHPVDRPDPLPDRTGDAIARHARDLVRRARDLPPHTRGVVGAITALVLLIVVMALVADTGETPPPDGPPSGVPSELQGPLQDLHDAVNG